MKKIFYWHAVQLEIMKLVKLILLSIMVSISLNAVAQINQPASYMPDNVKPEYPRDSKRLGEQGTVILSVLVTSGGTAGAVQVQHSSGFPRLDQSAVDAVKKWRFNPAKVNNKFIDEWFSVSIPFKLSVEVENADSGQLEASSSKYIFPTKGKIIKNFESSRKGIDIEGVEGQTVMASSDGIILYAQNMRGYGNLIIIDHNDGLVSAYAHNKKIVVREGQEVVKGQKIAEMGNTDADSARLHFEIRKLGKPVDPMGYLDGSLNSTALANEEKPNSIQPVERNISSSKSKLAIQASVSQPDANGVVAITVQTNADTSSLKVNGVEEGGRQDGNYLIKRVARIGQETQFKITATDIFGGSDSKVVAVTRQLPADTFLAAQLNLDKVKKQSTRDAVAIIIGIANYKNLPRADFANDDARVFYDYAQRALGIRPENIKLLADSEADEIEIIRAFTNWLPSRVKKNSTDVFVFFSGHGLPSEDGKNLYLLPSRADRDFLSRTAISQADINTALEGAHARSVTMFLDSCYSGLSRVGETLLASARPISIKAAQAVYPPNFIVISASLSDQISSSSPELRHGIFSFYLMKGMEGDADSNADGKITAGEFRDYLAEKVSKQAMGMNRKQDIQVIGDIRQVLVGR